MIVSESVNGDARRVNRILYYAGDSIEAIVVALDGITIDKVIDIVTSILDSAVSYHNG